MAHWGKALCGQHGGGSGETAVVWRGVGRAVPAERGKEETERIVWGNRNRKSAKKKNRAWVGSVGAAYQLELVGEPARGAPVVGPVRGGSGGIRAGNARRSGSVIRTRVLNINQYPR